MENFPKYLKKVIVYLVGLFVMALGVSVSKASELGVSPVNSIPSVLSDILKIDMGICTTAVFIGFILIQLIILRKDFKPVFLLQILCSAAFGIFVSLSNRLADAFLPPCGNYAARLLYILISMILVALGIMLYIQADILSLPGEGVMQALSVKTGISLPTAKIIFDWSVVIIAAATSLICLKTLSGVREGTVIAAFGVGLCLKLLNKLFLKPLQGFLETPAQ
ncbi:MAG: hypothetical protein K2N71_00875 [Oscillospiraceae bacterium]|nr:hypothetical protein [Oscillospiraceae bacterium]